MTSSAQAVDRKEEGLCYDVKNTPRDEETTEQAAKAKQEAEDEAQREAAEKARQEAAEKEANNS